MYFLAVFCGAFLCSIINTHGTLLDNIDASSIEPDKLSLRELQEIQYGKFFDSTVKLSQLVKQTMINNHNKKGMAIPLPSGEWAFEIQRDPSLERYSEYHPVILHQYALDGATRSRVIPLDLEPNEERMVVSISRMYHSSKINIVYQQHEDYNVFGFGLAQTPIQIKDFYLIN